MAPSKAKASASGERVLTPQDGSITESYAHFEAMIAFLRENGFRSVFPENARRGDARRALYILAGIHTETLG